MEWILYFKSIQWHQINVRGNKTASAQRHGGSASVMAFSGIDVTPTSTPNEERHPTEGDVNDKYVYVYVYVYVSTGVLSYSIHIQLFSQNQSLLSPI